MLIDELISLAELDRDYQVLIDVKPSGIKEHIAMETWLEWQRIVYLTSIKLTSN